MLCTAKISCIANIYSVQVGREWGSRATEGPKTGSEKTLERCERLGGCPHPYGLKELTLNVSRSTMGAGNADVEEGLCLCLSVFCLFEILLTGYILRHQQGAILMWVSVHSSNGCVLSLEQLLQLFVFPFHLFRPLIQLKQLRLDPDRWLSKLRTQFEKGAPFYIKI